MIDDENTRYQEGRGTHQHDIARRPLHTSQDNSESANRFSTLASVILDRTDTIIYSVVGLCFLIGAGVALLYSVWTFGAAIQAAFSSKSFDNIATDIIQFVSDLLLVLIIMEVLSTVIHYLKDHATSLQPFLFIGIISATRSILSIGARLSIGIHGVDVAGEFNRDMIELGVSAAVVLALGITLKILSNQPKHPISDS